MCGRYYRRSDKQKVAEAFHIRDSEGLIVPPWDYNVAPTTFQPVIRHTKEICSPDRRRLTRLPATLKQQLQ
jgi:putative SOS response-associated peptidase YedK